TVADRKPVAGYTDLKDDGSTACGCWIYAGCYKDGVNQTARRKPAGEQNWVAPEWGWAWPHNRRVLYNRASADPEGKPWSEWKRKDNPYHRPWGDPRFPYVLTTYRLTEHHTAGGMSRWLTWLSELQPEMFCEVSPELAREKGLTNGGWATITTARGEIEARV